MPERNPRPPRRRRWILVILALAYAALPFDLVPEALLPMIGWLDDAGVVSAAVAWWIRSRRRDQLAETAAGEQDSTPPTDVPQRS